MFYDSDKFWRRGAKSWCQFGRGMQAFLGDGRHFPRCKAASCRVTAGIMMIAWMLMRAGIFFISHRYVDALRVCSGSRPTMHCSVFNCSKFHPWGTITLMQQVLPAKPSDWSETHPNCADNSHQALLALIVGVPTLVGIISEIISHISCFSAVFHYFEANFSLQSCFGSCCIHVSCVFAGSCGECV